MADSIIADFAQFLLDEGKSPNTVTTYGRVLSKLDAWLQEQLPTTSLITLSARDLLAYFNFLRTSARAKPATLNLSRGAMSAFYKWTREQGLTDENPARKIKAVVSVKGAPKALSEAQMDRLIEAAMRCLRKRDGAMVLVLLMTGLRESELCQLLVEDVDFKHRTMTVYAGKGGKYRQLPLTAEICGVLSSYVNGERAELAGKLKRPHKRNNLFLGRRGPIARQTVFSVVKTVGKLAGIEGCHPHQLRHTYATIILNKTGDLTAVSELLGHSSIATTQIYTRPTQELLAERVQSALGHKVTRSSGTE